MKRYVENILSDKFSTIDFSFLDSYIEQSLNLQQTEYPPISDYTSYSVKQKNKISYKIYTGAGGNLYLYWKLVQNGNQQYIPQAMTSLQSCLKTIKKLEQSGSSTSFFMGDVGIYALASSIYLLNQEQENCQKYINLVLERESQVHSEDTQDELLFGNAGYLYCLLFLNKYCPGILYQKLCESSQRVVNQLYQIGFQPKSQTLLYQWPRGKGKYYLGAAHGLLGVLQMILLSYINFPEIVDSDIIQTVQKTLD